jgi:hypothetical protein
MVYYGDEVAVNSPSLTSSGNGPIGDPYTRPPYPWIDQAGDPTIYGPPDTSVESYYTKLAHLRKQYPVLRDGAFVTLLTGDTQEASTAASTYAYARTDGTTTAVVAMNNGSAANAASVPVGAYFADGSSLEDPISGNTYSVTGGNVTVNLAAHSGVVLLPAPATIDLTPPTASISLNPSANGNGWINHSPVTADISGFDSGSGVAALRYWVDNGSVTVVTGLTASVTITGEGTHTIGARAFDNAGNVSTPVSATVNIDLTPPTVTCQAAPTFTWNQSNAKVTATVMDALSGAAASTVSATVPTSQVGTHSVTLTGADKAGNTASANCSYLVDYKFTGFFPPISSGTNKAVAGSLILVDFSIGGFDGLRIFASGSPASQQVSCTTGAAIGSPQMVDVLLIPLYDPFTRDYFFIWQTERSWKNTCRQLQVKLEDGTTHTALFQFK